MILEPIEYSVSGFVLPTRGLSACATQPALRDSVLQNTSALNEADRSAVAHGQLMDACRRLEADKVSH